MHAEPAPSSPALMLPPLCAAGCATSFPHALMMAASFNRSLWAAVGEAIGVEGRAFWNQGGAAEPNPLGALNFWAPDVSLWFLELVCSRARAVRLTQKASVCFRSTCSAIRAG